MHNLRSLFNMRRFVGCENPRQLFFAKEEASPLSLCCEETPAGGAQLLLADAGRRLLPQDFPLPPHVHERCRFWNHWVSHALENEWEHPLSPYGPEAYAASIAIDIATACPDRPVDWCGLPVHDEYALQQKLEALYSSTKGRSPIPALPSPSTGNTYTQALLQAAKNESAGLTFKGYQAYCIDYYDVGRLFYNEVSGARQYTTRYTNSLDTSAPPYPSWLDKQITACGMIYGCDVTYECLGWTRCSLLHTFLRDACGIDVMRYHPRHVDICSSDYYIARAEDFPPFEG